VDAKLFKIGFGGCGYHKVTKDTKYDEFLSLTIHSLRWLHRNHIYFENFLVKIWSRSGETSLRRGN
ncbi:MAG: hypothetical protein ACK5QS_00360, partial [Pseudanabaenaceae cyanobacterium]